MTLKNIERATKILEQIKHFDTEIIKVEKIAMIIANKECDVSLSLTVLDKQAKREAENKVTLDEDGFMRMHSGIHQSFHDYMIRRLHRLHALPWGHDYGDVGKDFKENQHVVLDDCSGLEVIGVIVSFYKTKRKSLIKELTAMGFELK